MHYIRTNTPSTYTLDRLQAQYQEEQLQPKGKKQMVTDEEVCIFLNEGHWIWPIVFWATITGIFLFLAVMK